jgi:hypothetical protein
LKSGCQWLSRVAADTQLKVSVVTLTNIHSRMQITLAEGGPAATDRGVVLGLAKFRCG